MSYAPVSQRQAMKQDVEIEAHSVNGNATKLSGKWLTIIFCLVASAVPMIILTVVLVVLVSMYRVNLGEAPFPALQPLGTTFDSAPYYIDLSATTLIFVASWSSSAAPICAGFLITLASYPICSLYLQSIQTGRDQELPTPYQLALIIRFLGGGSFGALWTWITYVFSWSKKRRAVAALRWIISITIFSIGLGVLVLLADTWLHLATKAVNVVVFSDNPDSSYSFGLNYNFTRPDCRGEEAGRKCAVNIATTSIGLKEPTNSWQVLANTSKLATVNTLVNDRGSFAYFALPTAEDVSSIDYTASTFGLQTQCRPMTRQCKTFVESGAFTMYNCSESFQGNIMVQQFAKKVFYDASMNNNKTTNPAASGELKGPTYYFGAAAVNVPGTLIDPELEKDVEMKRTMHGAWTTIMLCNTTTYDMTIDVVNGTVTRLDTKASNDTQVNLFAAPMLTSTIGDQNFALAASAAIIQGKTAQDVADQFAASYSIIALSLAAQAMERRPSIAAQTRQSRLLTKLEKPPFYALIAANLLFALVGLALAIWAAVVAEQSVHELQARLTVFGLAADRFEGQRAREALGSTDMAFEERVAESSARVAVLPSDEGGFEFRLRRTDR